MNDTLGGARGPRRLAPLAAAAAIVLALTPAAQAQGFFSFFFGGPTPGEIERGLNASGYVLTGPLVRRGDVYLADVSMGPRDYERLVIDSETGRILQRFRTRRPRVGAPAGDLSRDASVDWGTPPRPPAGLDGAPGEGFDTTRPQVVTPRASAAKPAIAPTTAATPVAKAVAPRAPDKLPATAASPAAPEPTPTKSPGAAPSAKADAATTAAPAKTKAVNDLPVTPLD